MHDGSRHFADAPYRSAHAIVKRLKSTPGAALTNCLDTPLEIWIDFDYRGHSFTMHSDLYGDYWLFVKNPVCPDGVLEDVARFLG
jgi:hypothetical protein